MSVLTTEQVDLPSAGETSFSRFMATCGVPKRDRNLTLFHTEYQPVVSDWVIDNSEEPTENALIIGKDWDQLHKVTAGMVQDLFRQPKFEKRYFTKQSRVLRWTNEYELHHAVRNDEAHDFLAAMVLVAELPLWGRQTLQGLESVVLARATRGRPTILMARSRDLADHLREESRILDAIRKGGVVIDLTSAR